VLVQAGLCELLHAVLLPVIISCGILLITINTQFAKADANRCGFSRDVTHDISTACANFREASVKIPNALSLLTLILRRYRLHPTTSLQALPP